MSNFGKTLSESAAELRKLRVLTCCAVLGAMGMALKSASIDIGPTISIGFSGLPNQIVDMLFGPVTGAAFAAVMDVLKYFMKPTGPFHFGFTFDAMLAAFIYGCFYYKKPVRFWRVLTAKAIIEVVVNLGLATYWHSQLMGDAFFATLSIRAGWSLLVSWPLNTAVFYIVAKGLEEAGVFRMVKK